PLPQADLLPLARDLLGNPLLVGKARRKRARLVLAGLADNHRGPLPADLLIAGESQARLAEILVETGRDDIAVLDRHHAALAQDRQRRMARVAEQGDAALRPGLHRLADHQGPFVRRLDLIDHDLDVGVPIAEIVAQLFLGPYRGPGLDLPIVALRRAHEVHDLAAAHRIVQHVAARTEPVRSDHPSKTGRQLLHRDQAAPGDAGGEYRLARPEQADADLGMNTIGADQIRRLDGAAVLEHRFDVSAVGDDRDASLVQPDGVGLERANRVGEEAVQIGAVQHEMRRAESLDAFVAEIEPVPGFAGAPVPHLAGLRPNLHFVERRFQAERIQGAGTIGADLDAGAHDIEMDLQVLH